MSKCRYDLSEDCNNKDCLTCILDKISDEIRNERNMDYKCHRKTYDNCLKILDKYKADKPESEDRR